MTPSERSVLESDVIQAAMACHLTQHGAHILLSMLDTPEEAAKLLATLAQLREMRQ